MEVLAGFIVGFDTDRDDIFERQIEFIQKSGIAMAMVGIMMALPKTQLHRRLEAEGRLLHESNGNNGNEISINFIPKMDTDVLFEGYKHVLSEIYTPRNYFKRGYTLVSRVPRSVGSRPTEVPAVARANANECQRSTPVAVGPTEELPVSVSPRSEGSSLSSDESPMEVVCCERRSWLLQPPSSLGAIS